MCSEKKETKTNEACCDPKDFISMMEKCCEGKTVTFDCSTILEVMKNSCSCGTASKDTKSDNCC